MAEGGDSNGARALKPEEKARLGILALPTFALAFGITIVSTYLGEVTRRYTHDTEIIGAIIGGEGIMALWVPMIFGTWSDRAQTRLGGRLPFVIAGAVPAAVAMALIGFLHTLGTVALVTAVFFAFYFVAYEPYRAMYPDLVGDDDVAGRAQSSQAIARGFGTGCALLGGGLLLSVWRPLPFFFAGIVLVTAVSAFVWLAVRSGIGKRQRKRTDGQAQEHSSHLAAIAQVARGIAGLVRCHPALRAYFFANALWEMALAALKAFIILYLTIGLHYKLSTSSLIIGGVAVIILIGAGVSGKLGDRFGHIRVVRIAVILYGLGYLVPIFTTSRIAIGAAVPFIALGGGTLMTLAYALLMPLMPEDEHGALTGYYSMSRGVGIVLGPVLAGILVEVTKGSLFKSTHGFAAMWIVCAAAAFASLFFLAWLRRSSEDRQALERQ
ncbi:MAG TPA: MFS transporter [Solirubrobacteraceae bacterium]|nr:MFS transporter [Solirubrobacteraceae bacterium]